VLFLYQSQKTNYVKELAMVDVKLALQYVYKKTVPHIVTADTGITDNILGFKRNVLVG